MKTTPGAHLPLEGIQGVHAHIDKDGALADIAECLAGAHKRHTCRSADVVQCIVRDSNRAAEQCHDAAQACQFPAQVRQIAQHANQGNFLSQARCKCQKRWQDVILQRLATMLLVQLRACSQLQPCLRGMHACIEVAKQSCLIAMGQRHIRPVSKGSKWKSQLAWGTELDLKRFMRKAVPRPNARPRNMLAANKYRNLMRTVMTRLACRFFSLLPSSCSMCSCHINLCLVDCMESDGHINLAVFLSYSTAIFNLSVSMMCTSEAMHASSIMLFTEAAND